MSEKKPFVIPTNPVVLSYIAGIVDGEAYVGIDKQSAPIKHRVRRNDFYRLNVAVKATDKRMTDYLMEHVGGYYRTELRRTVNGRTVHTWNVDGRKAEGLLGALIPFLVCKADQARIALEFRKSFGPSYCKWGTPPEVVSFRHGCYEKLKAIHGRHSGKSSPPSALRLPA